MKYLVIAFVIISCSCFGQQDSVVIKGWILTKENSKPIPSALVIVQHTGFGDSTDVNGRFQLKIPASVFERSFLLKTYYTGYCFDSVLIKPNGIIEPVIYGTINPNDFSTGIPVQFPVPVSGSSKKNK